MENKVCIICGKEYVPDKRNYRRQLTCSKKCATRKDTIRETQKCRETRKEIYRQCKVCGEKFLVHYRNPRLHIYCSETCLRYAMCQRAIESGRKKLYAKADYEKHKEEILRKQKIAWDRRNFGGNRLKAIERDSYKCTMCGFMEGLHVHHKDKNRKNNSLENLQTLCAGCHSRIHNTLYPVCKCKIEGCKRTQHARGMCRHHYNKRIK